MNKIIIIRILVVMICCIIASDLHAVFNVRDYGATGNGTTDDTAAIQAAINAADLKAVSAPYNGGPYFSDYPVVYFPSSPNANVYRVDGTLTLKRCNLLGDGNTNLYKLSGNNTDFIFATNIWRVKISNLGFCGGCNQINIGNQNIDIGQITIENCQFNQSTGCAIKIGVKSYSTILTVKGCTFIRCDQALINWCDKATLSDSWITTSVNMSNKAAIENHSTLTIERMCGVPATGYPIATNNDMRWIDNYNNYNDNNDGIYRPGVLICRDCRFGGEGGGFTPVVNWAIYDSTYPINPSGVILDSCEIYGCGNVNRQAAVYCEAIPNQIAITKSRGFAVIKAIAVASSIDLSTYLDNASNRDYNGLSFLVDKTNVEIYGYAYRDLPEEMRPYQANVVEGTAAPIYGYWKVGSFVRNRNCNSPSVPFGWQCTMAGKPGTWIDRYMN